MTTQTAPISLIEIASAIEASASGVRENVLTTKKPVHLSASQLAKKVASLKALGDTPLLRCTSYELKGKEIFSVNPISLHLNEDGNSVELYDASLEKLECEIKSYEIKPQINRGSAIVEIEGIELEVAIHLNAEKIADLQDEKLIMGVGTPPVELIEKFPEIVKKLESFEFHTDIKIVEQTGFSRKFDTPLFTVEYQGKKCRNVISNSEMVRGYEKYGDDSTFQIVGTKPTKTGNKLYLKFEGDIDFSDI